MATHSSIPAWKIPWTEEPGGLQSMGCKELDMTERTCVRAHTHMDVMAILYFSLAFAQSWCLQHIIYTVGTTICLTHTMR